LALIREPEKLREWPPEQQTRCRKLWRDVETLIAIAQPTPDSAAQIDADSLKHGRNLIAKGDWAGAVDRYAQALAQNSSDDGEFWFEYAALLLLSGDRAGYVEACARMLERGGVPEMRAYHVARAGTLAEGGIPLASALDNLAGHGELRANATQFWAQTEQGALAYRAGRFQEAASFFEQSLNTDARPGRAVVNWVWLALAEQRLGKADEAQRWLAKAQNWLDQYRDGMPPNADTKLGLHIHNWLEANILRREAESLLSQK
jgi:tetratricopeptide (TPR) repeat protein